MKTVVDRLFGKKINDTRVVPLMLKIVSIFIVFLLASNFTSNYFNLIRNRSEQIRLMKDLLVKDLKDIHIFALNQHDIYDFNADFEAAVKNMEDRSIKNLKGEKSLTLGVRSDGTLLFQASRLPRVEGFPDAQALERMQVALQQGSEEGAINFRFNRQDYFGAYKYNQRWDAFILRSEELGEFYSESARIFTEVSVFIVLVTILCVVVGILLIRYILRYMSVITSSLMKMQKGQRIDLIDMQGTPNDDIGYLGIAFNALASTIDNLMTIFKKFVARDIAAKAYREREVRLEGTKKELTILFSDIRGFTFMTETLGNDIIKLLNLHYDKAIRQIHENNGDIGSLIGDALLAIFGALEEDHQNKSYQAIKAGYQLHDVAATLRQDMYQRREGIIKSRGALTEEEESIFQAVLLEIGVGIDGGEVFYGNIGSNERMVNTVIGDNVNSASRLEGLTRFYKIPMIVSQYVKEDVEKDFADFHFLEIDQVQVKGKTMGKRIYWPLDPARMDNSMQQDVDYYDQALREYYQGNWPKAHKLFNRCTLPLAAVFQARTRGSCPKDWNGIWTMREK